MRLETIPSTRPRKFATLRNAILGPEWSECDPASQARVRRRLAAIMFADVVGYSRLTGEDEVGTWRSLQGVLREVVRPIVEAHAGRVISVKGDGILIEFASAVDAVASAIALQQAMRLRNAAVPNARRIQLRVGINLGDVMIHGHDLLGDGVNLAARLESLAEPGGICISATVHEHVRAKLPFPFEDRGERSVKNIATPVRIYMIGPETIAQLPIDIPVGYVPASAWRWLAVPFALVIVAAAALLASWLYLSRTSETPGAQLASSDAPAAPTAEPFRLASAPPLSIVVLPFTHMDGDAKQEYLADAITEDLTTDLSRIPGSFVISLNTALTYKDKRVDVRQIGRDLSVRYVLRGSVRRAQDSVRVNAQLVETEGASQLWAARFEGDIARLATMQDSVTRRIADAMNVALIEAESQRVQRERPNNPDAVDLTMRGLALMNKPPSRESAQRARELFENALQLSPDHLPALHGLGHVMLVEWGSTWHSGSSDAHLAAIERLVDRILAIDPNDALAMYFDGYVEKRLHKNLDQALVALERAITLDPNLAVAQNHIGQIKLFLGRAEEAAAHTLKALRLSPRDPRLAEWYYQMALNRIHQQHYDEAVDWARRGTQANPNLRYPYRVLAVALALSGRIDEARMTAVEMLRRYPDETIRSFLEREPWTDPVYRAGQEREVAGMRLAGVPE